MNERGKKDIINVRERSFLMPGTGVEDKWKISARGMKTLEGKIPGYENLRTYFTGV